jgi:predicted dehydrogenase
MIFGCNCFTKNSCKVGDYLGRKHYFDAFIYNQNNEMNKEKEQNMNSETSNPQRPVRFGLIGAGWRADFFFRIAQALPERFEVAGVYARNPDRRAELREKWGFLTPDSMEALADVPDVDFVIVSVSWAASPVVHKFLHQRGIFALGETPPAPDLPSLIDLYENTNGGERIQIAEQYAFQPMHAARLAIAHSGRLGEVTQAQVSIAHGYHGISLMRKFLGLTFEDVTIHSAREFKSPLQEGPGFRGNPTRDRVNESTQQLAQFDFDGKLGVFDFTGDQYFSWVRSPRLLVRGELGEINNKEVRYLIDYHTPVELELRRSSAGEEGNLEGYYLKGILAGSEWLYRNPFTPGRLTDDEIAIATCFEKMAAFAHGSQAFYPLAEASQDHYLNLLLGQAIQTGQAVKSEKQVWAK